MLLSIGCSRILHSGCADRTSSADWKSSEPRTSREIGLPRFEVAANPKARHRSPSTTHRVERGRGNGMAEAGCRRRVEPTDDRERLELLCRWPERLAYEEMRPTGHGALPPDTEGLFQERRGGWGARPGDDLDDRARVPRLGRLPDQGVREVGAGGDPAG